ncbi:MAG TPA: DUF1566 domain-containing protein [bacterium]|nr:DUF1566 domain-containing protein [bacterium]
MFQLPKKAGLFLLGLCLGWMASAPAFAGGIKPWTQITDVSQRFVVLTDFGGDTVLDRSTGLLWDRSPEGGNYSWYGAHRRCIFVGNGTSNELGWRLPKVEELHSLMYVTGSNPGGLASALPAGHPFNLSGIAAGTRFWTATSYQAENNDVTEAWTANPAGNFGSDLKTEGNGVWCVRGGAN